MPSPKRRRRVPQRHKPSQGKKLAPSRFAQVRGSATVKMTTEEIMSLTRGGNWRGDEP